MWAHLTCTRCTSMAFRSYASLLTHRLSFTHDVSSVVLQAMSHHLHAIDDSSGVLSHHDSAHLMSHHDLNTHA